VDGGIGILLLVAFVAFACVVGVVLILAIVFGVSLGGIGFLAIRDRANRAKRLASEAGTEDAW
jgi:hypothetical protein